MTIAACLAGKNWLVLETSWHRENQPSQFHPASTHAQLISNTWRQQHIQPRQKNGANSSSIQWRQTQHPFK